MGTVGVAPGHAANSGVVVCPAVGTVIEPIVLPQVDTQPLLPRKPFRIDYRSLSLRFTARRPGSGSWCEVRSNVGALPVDVVVPSTGSGVSIHVADSVTTATLDVVAVSETSARACDFAVLAEAGPTAPFGAARLPGPLHDCFLNAPRAGDLAIRWSIPGFHEFVDVFGLPVLVTSTPPLTYYVDAPALLGAGPLAFDETTLERIETFIHTTLIANLPLLAPIGIIQDPPAQITVTDPTGLMAGFGIDRSGILGASYTDVGDTSILVLPRPAVGTYRVELSGDPGSPFTLAAAWVRPLAGTTAGSGDPLIAATSMTGRLSAAGQLDVGVSLGPTG